MEQTRIKAPCFRLVKQVNKYSGEARAVCCTLLNENRGELLIVSLAPVGDSGIMSAHTF